MPVMGPCFSYPPVDENRRSLRSAPPGVRQMPGTTTCFRYPSISPGVRQMPTSGTCFRYQPDLPSAPPGLRQMPGTTSCFRY